MGASLSRKAVDFDSAMRRFESSRPSQAVRRPEEIALTLAERPPMAGYCELATSLQAPIFGILRPKSPIVSGGHQKKSRFWETAAGDRVRSALRGRSNDSKATEFRVMVPEPGWFFMSGVLVRYRADACGGGPVGNPPIVLVPQE